MFHRNSMLHYSQEYTDRPNIRTDQKERSLTERFGPYPRTGKLKSRTSSDQDREKYYSIR